MKYTTSIFLMLLLITCSCAKTSNQDHSLTPDEYLNFGMPDYSKIWSYDDYRNACDILGDIKATNPLSLPKKSSDRSGMYFDRIINPDNLDFVQDESLSLQQKAYKIQSYKHIQEFLIKIYTDLDSTEQYYHRELIDLYIFSISIAQNMLDIGYQINESVNENDMVMQSGFPGIQSRYINTVSFILEIQERDSLFEPEDLERLSDFLSSSILLNKDWMEGSAIEDVKQQVQKLIDNSSSEYVIKQYNNLIESL